MDEREKQLRYLRAKTFTDSHMVLLLMETGFGALIYAALVHVFRPPVSADLKLILVDKLTALKRLFSGMTG